MPFQARNRPVEKEKVLNKCPSCKMRSIVRAINFSEAGTSGVLYWACENPHCRVKVFEEEKEGE